MAFVTARVKMPKRPLPRATDRYVPRNRRGELSDVASSNATSPPLFHQPQMKAFQGVGSASNHRLRQEKYSCSERPVRHRALAWRKNLVK
jgi:hypothetical protein